MCRNKRGPGTFGEIMAMRVLVYGVMLVEYIVIIRITLHTKHPETPLKNTIYSMLNRNLCDVRYSICSYCFCSVWSNKLAPPIEEKIQKTIGPMSISVPKYIFQVLILQWNVTAAVTLSKNITCFWLLLLINESLSLNTEAWKILVIDERSTAWNKH